MKKLSTISLFIFGVIVTAILVAGLVVYQNKNDSKNNQNQVEGQSIIITPGTTLNMGEIQKHNQKNDCWMLISGKVYNITSYFGFHPGGNSVMAQTCGIDSTVAYATQNPNATSSGGKSAHSSNAVSLLNNYYIGDLNQTISQQKVTEINATPTPITRGDDD